MQLIKKHWIISFLNGWSSSAFISGEALAGRQGSWNRNEGSYLYFAPISVTAITSTKSGNLTQLYPLKFLTATLGRIEVIISSPMLGLALFPSCVTLDWAILREASFFEQGKSQFCAREVPSKGWTVSAVAPDPESESGLQYLRALCPPACQHFWGSVCSFTK